MEKISIIVPIYNVKEEYFKKCMETLINQTVDDIEIILINDGSTNNSGELCDKYSKQDKRVRVFHQENQGVSVARNKGIEEAKGKWILFVDPDDWIELDLCERLLNHTKEKEYDIIIFSFEEIFLNKKVRKNWNNKKEHIFNSSEIELLQQQILDYNGKFINNYFGAVWGNLFRKEFLSKYNINFPKGIVKAEDTLFNLYALEKAQNIKYIDEVLYHYRHSDMSACYKYNNKIDQNLIQMLKEIEKFMIDNKKDNKLEYINSYYHKVYVSLIETLKLNYFHKDNNLGYFTNKKNFLKLINESIYKEMVNQNQFKERNKKMIVFMIKYKMYFLLSNIFKIKLYINDLANKPF